MSITVVRQMLFNVFKYKIENHDLLKSIINECVPNNTKLASMYGYHTFQHAHFKSIIQERYNYLNHKNKL